MKPIRVLIIDDSAFARKVIREVLSRDLAIEVVGIARDGLEGLEKINELRPDVVTLDLIMPELDGLGLLQALKNIWAPKVVLVSVSGSETELALEALALGAFDLVAKPTPIASDLLYTLGDELLLKIKAAAASMSYVRVPPAAPIGKLAAVSETSAVRVAVIGTSTGGPQAITELFRTLPEGLPISIAVALHIPAGYTGPLADRVSKNSAVKLTEAHDGMEVLAGTAVIAPGGMHLRLRNENGRVIAEVSREPLGTPHHPSVDVLFQSAALAFREAVVGIVMTGMGSDGLEGARAIRETGGRVLAESASSCVVYGMPRTVIEAGLVDGEAPLERMVPLMMNHFYPGKI